MTNRFAAAAWRRNDHIRCFYLTINERINHRTLTTVRANSICVNAVNDPILCVLTELNEKRVTFGDTFLIFTKNNAQIDALLATSSKLEQSLIRINEHGALVNVSFFLIQQST